MPAKMNHSDAVFRVCVDEISEGRIRGHVVSRRLTAPISFQDVGDFLIKLEELMDRQNFPQAFERTRTFRPRPAGASHVPAADGLEGGMSKEGCSSDLCPLRHHPPQHYMAGHRGLAGRISPQRLLQRAGAHQADRRAYFQLNLDFLPLPGRILPTGERSFFTKEGEAWERGSNGADPARSRS